MSETTPLGDMQMNGNPAQGQILRRRLILLTQKGTVSQQQCTSALLAGKETMIVRVSTDSRLILLSPHTAVRLIYK
jgi:hypothetical protein